MAYYVCPKHDYNGVAPCVSCAFETKFNGLKAVAKPDVISSLRKQLAQLAEALDTQVPREALEQANRDRDLARLEAQREKERGGRWMASAMHQNKQNAELRDELARLTAVIQNVVSCCNTCHQNYVCQSCRWLREGLENKS